MIEPVQIPAVSDHELIRLIGSGSSGQVWLAKNALGTYRAVKIVHKKISHIVGSLSVNSTVF